jgi:hypothetical protein
MDQDKPAGDNDKGTAVVADDWEETLKRVGHASQGSGDQGLASR